MVDGKRSVDELREMLLTDDLQHTLGLLEETGLIEMSSVTDAAGKAGSPHDQMPPITAFAKLPDSPDPLRMQQARNFMTNTLNAFVGALGTSSLLDRIEQAAGHTELRAYYDEWYHAIVMSREGKRQAEDLRSKLLLVI